MKNFIKKSAFITALSAVLLLAGCNADKKYIWNSGSYPNNYFSSEFSESASGILEELRSELAAEGVSPEDNRIVIDSCIFYKTGETTGYYTKAYRHIMGNDFSLFEVYYFDGEDEKLIDESDKLSFGTAVCDGEKLYYLLDDGTLRSINKNGEISDRKTAADSNVLVSLNGNENTIEITDVSGETLDTITL